MMSSTLYFGGPIHTMDATNSRPEAVLTKGSRIAAVGPETKLRAEMPRDTEEVNLAGRALLPAFIDPHGHFPDSGFAELFRVDLSSPPRGSCRDIEEALDRLSHKARQTKHGEWVMGVLFDNTTIAERRMPTRDELDRVSSEHPVWVLHASGHNGVANSIALARASIANDTSDPMGGRFGRDPATRTLTGLIEGISAMGAMGDTTFLIDKDRFWEGFAAARDEYLNYGVTLAQNAWTSRKLLEHFASLSEDKDPGIDVVLFPVGEEEPGMTVGRDSVPWPGNPYFTIGPRKLFTDGAFQLQTAWLSEPYLSPVNPDRPCGMAYKDPAEFHAEVRRLHCLGYQLHCHCNGDRGAELFIDAVDAALADDPREDHRHTVIHGQTLRDDQLARMARLGMTVSFFSAHIHFWGDLHHDVLLGPERANRISPAASAERAGVRFTLHNDASVTPTRPLHLADCAVERLTASGRSLGQAQRIGRLSALRAQTIDAAWQVFLEHERGSIEVGKLADLAILMHDPLDPEHRLKDNRVTSTIRRGVGTHRTTPNLP